MPADPSLPTLHRLTEDVAKAMTRTEAAQRSPRRWPGLKNPVVVALFALAAGVPTALAVRSVVRTDTRVDLPDYKMVDGKPAGINASAFVVAQGFDHHRYWTVFVRRCVTDGVVTMVPGDSIGRRRGGLGHNGGGFSQCPPRTFGQSRQQPLLQPSSAWTQNLSVIYGIVPARVSSVELRVHDRNRERRRHPAPSFHLRVATRPLPPEAIRQGRLPQGYRVFAVPHRGNLMYTRAIARDARNRVLRNCPIRRCDSLARRGF